MSLVELPTAPVQAQHFIGGQWVDGNEGSARTSLVSPYSGAEIGQVPLASSEEVARCVAAAKEAAQGWRRTPLKERTQVLFRYRQLLHDHIDEMANLSAIESGKTVAEGRAGVLKGIEVVEFALSLQNLDDGAMLEVSRGVTCEVRREPLGVVAGITPFNFPAMVPMWLYPIAITVGNAFILKPSEKAPLTANLNARLLTEAGLPAGVFSILHGGREAAEGLATHPDVAALAFVGSTPIARSVYGAATGAGKRALCLGGAKNHLIVVPDADPKVTVDGVVRSFTGCAGQRCMAASLMVAVGDAPEIDPLIDAVADATRALVLGRDMGAIISAEANTRLREAIARAESEGAKVRVDGREVPAPEGYEGGHWLGPTVLDHATQEMDCARTELFGPVLTIVRVPTLEAAMRLGRDNPYGNATSVFTTNGGVASYVAAHADAGMIGVNVGVPVPREPFSFGGTKASRFGMGDVTGRDGVALWTQQKKITTKWALQADANWMS